MNKHEAYTYQLSRLTEEEKTMLNLKEQNIGRKLLPWEITTIFQLDHEKTVPKPNYDFEEEQDKRWMDQ